MVGTRFHEPQIWGKKQMWWMIVGMAVAVLAGALWGPIVSNVEQSKYQVVEKHDNIEIRDYAPMVVAETEVSGERDKAISEGFRTIAAYIFGDNTSAKKVAMTAPVTQQGSEKISTRLEKTIDLDYEAVKKNASTCPL